MKQFVKALDKNCDCFKYLCDKFPYLSDEKLKEGIFVGPQIRKLTSDDQFEETMSSIEKSAWIALKDVINNFLGNNRAPNYKEIVNNMLDKFQEFGCNMNLKPHFLNSHLDYFPENLGAVSEEQGERFHQDIKEMERRYQGRWNINMMGDYCLMMKRESPDFAHSRMGTKRSFQTTRTRFH